jgi:hypothetical protein
MLIGHSSGIALLGVAGEQFFVRDAWSQTTATFDYYISPTGDDVNPGTQSQPWSITALNSKQSVYAGKRVGLLDGVYQYGTNSGVQTTLNSLCNAAAYSRPALLVNGGTSGSPTIIAAVNARQAVLDGSALSGGALPTTQAAIIGQGYSGQTNIGNVVLDGLVVRNSYQLGICFYPNSGQTQGGATGTIVRNCEIYNIAGWENGNMAGVLFYFNTGALVQNCAIHDVVPTSGNMTEWDCAGIFSQQCLNNIYEFNTIYNCNCAIYDKNPNNGGHTYRFNYLEVMGVYPNVGLIDCAGGSAGETTAVYNNIIVSPTCAWGTDSTLPANCSWKFYNNTCWFPNGGFTHDAGVFLPTAGAAVSPAAQVQFFNNIVACAGTVTSNGNTCFCDGTILLSDFNCFQGALSNGATFGISPTTSPYSFVSYTLAGWQSHSGFDLHSQTLPVGALFGSAVLKNPASFRSLPPGVVGTGRIGGVSSGAVTDPGAWGNGATQIGCNFGPVAVPTAPVLSIQTAQAS